MPKTNRVWCHKVQAGHSNPKETTDIQRHTPPAPPEASKWRRSKRERETKGTGGMGKGGRTGCSLVLSNNLMRWFAMPPGTTAESWPMLPLRSTSGSVTLGLLLSKARQTLLVWVTSWGRCYLRAVHKTLHPSPGHPGISGHMGMKTRDHLALCLE